MVLSIVADMRRSRYPYDYDYPVRYEGPNPESFQQMEPTLARSETLSLIQKAVDTARAGMQQSLAGSERVGEAVKLKLTIDLGHQGIEMLPDEVVHILKRDVERYAVPASKLAVSSLMQIHSTSALRTPTCNLLLMIFVGSFFRITISGISHTSSPNAPL